MWNFLDSASHRHLVGPHKKATLSWRTQAGQPVLKVEYHHKHKLTSAGFRIPIILEPNQNYQLSLEARLIKGDPAFIYVETESGQRLLSRFKIHKHPISLDPKENFKFEQQFQAPSQVETIYLGILFFYPEIDYELAVYKFQLQKVKRLTSQNLIEIDSKSPKQLPTESLVDLSICPTIVDQKLEQKSGQKLEQTRNLAQLPVEASEITLTPSEYQYIHETPSLRSAIQWPEASRFIELEKRLISLEKASQLPDTESEQPSEKELFLISPVTKKTVQIVDVPEPSSVVQQVPPMISQNEEINGFIPRPTRSTLKPFRKKSIVITLTTIPQRLGKIVPVIESLLSQSLPIKKLYLVIPTRYKRYGKPYLIQKKWSQMDSRLQIVRCPDVGPMTKLMGLMELKEINKNTLILTADDDHIYPPHWAYYLSYLAVYKPDFKGVFGLKGFKDQTWHSSGSSYQPMNLDWIAGEWGLAGYQQWFQSPSQLLKQVNVCPEAIYSDDLLVANHLANFETARILVPAVPKSALPKRAGWSKDRWSLHRLAGGIISRYLLVSEALKAKKMHHLSQLGPKFDVQSGMVIEVETTTSSKNKLEPDQELALLANSSRTINNLNTIQTTTKNWLDDPQTGNGESAVFSSQVAPNEKLQLFYSPNYQTTCPKLNIQLLQKQKILYLSYWTQLENYQLVLLYLKKLPNCHLYFPMISGQVSEHYQPYLQKQLPKKTNKEGKPTYDVTIVDVPYCFQGIELPNYVNQTVPLYYIYRYPEIGLAQQMDSPLIVNANYYNLKQAIAWRILPEIETVSLSTYWNPRQKHCALIVNQPDYLTNLTNLLLFWQKNQTTTLADWKLHLGVVPSLALKVQEFVNEQKITGINIYNQVKLFGTIIDKCSFYFSLGYYLDYYAIWAHQKKKKLIMIKWGEFFRYPGIVAIPYELGTQRICFHSDKQSPWHSLHQRCSSHHCQLWGDQEIKGVPVIKEQELKKIIQSFS